MLPEARELLPKFVVLLWRKAFAMHYGASASRLIRASEKRELERDKLAFYCGRGLPTR